MGDEFCKKKHLEYNEGCQKCKDKVNPKTTQANAFHDMLKELHEEGYPVIAGVDFNSHKNTITYGEFMKRNEKGAFTLQNVYEQLGLLKKTDGHSTIKKRTAGAQPDKIDDNVKTQTIDFFFKSDEFTSLAGLELVKEEDIDDKRYLPNYRCGSDHTEIVAKVRLGPEHGYKTNKDYADREGFELIKFRKGDTVEVCGLQNAKQHNGKRGTLTKWLSEAGRWQVQLLEGGNMIAAKPKNLKHLNKKESDSRN